MLSIILAASIYLFEPSSILGVRSAWGLTAVIEEYSERINKPFAETAKIVIVVDRLAKAYGIDPWLILGMIQIESAGDPYAVSKVGARGLMQIMPATGEYIAGILGEEWKGVDSLFDIDLNIRFGVWYFRFLLDKFEGNVKLALAGYNFGPTRINQRLTDGKKIPSVYAIKVLKAAYGH